MTNIPPINRSHKICVICEGYEDYEYFSRLMTLNVWRNNYSFTTINAKGAAKIPAVFQDAFQNNRYEVILVFCDTDKAPYKEYSIVKKKINSFLNKRKADEKLIIFANPCTMQIILSHFGDVSLRNQGKKTNASVIEKLTGVKDYDAHIDQIKSICNMIFKNNYDDMKQRVATINFPDTTSCSTNFIRFIELFECEDDKWISTIQKYLRESETVALSIDN